MALPLDQSAESAIAILQPTHVHATEASIPRIAFLDALRGLAAVAVFVYHVFVWTIPSFEAWSDRYADLGALGVGVFFVISGYIIPSSLERQGLRSFWIRRICRIYPLYWWVLFCFVSVMVIAHIPPIGQQTIDLLEQPLANGLANALLLQYAVGQQNIVPNAWTLHYELIFYTLMSLLLISRLYQRTYLIASVCLAAGLLIAYVTASGMLSIAMLLMFSGLVIQRLDHGRASPSFALGFGLLAAVSILALPLLPGKSLMMALAIPVFGLGYLLRSLPMPRVLLFLGRISYSIYLLHILVMMVVPAVPNQLLSVLIWGAAVLGVSSLSERLIERPGIELGRRLSRTRLGS
jgi:peptidoglycan/LPS O-acetylase OafA/YrhL